MREAGARQLQVTPTVRLPIVCIVHSCLFLPKKNFCFMTLHVRGQVGGSSTPDGAKSITAALTPATSLSLSCLLHVAIAAVSYVCDLPQHDENGALKDAPVCDPTRPQE